MKEYHRLVRRGDLLDGDARQVEALRALQALRNRLVENPPDDTQRLHDEAAASTAVITRVTRAALGLVPIPMASSMTTAPMSSLPWWTSSSSSNHPESSISTPSQGVYLHGGVGRGKTMLMDLFHSTLPPHLARLTRRTHFHEFMSEVHRRLHDFRRDHRSAHAAADPLASVAAAVHAESPVLCFDEVELVDVADALVLKRVFEHVFALGGILIATSNAAPEELYEGGINRAAFIPFIGTLRERCTVVSLDYRRHKEAEEVVTDGGAGAPVALGKINISAGIDYRMKLADCRRKVVQDLMEGGVNDDTLSSSRGVDMETSSSLSSFGSRERPSVACGESSVLVTRRGGTSSTSYAESAVLRRMWEVAAAVSSRRMTATSNGVEVRDGDRAGKVQEEKEEEEIDVRVPVASGRSIVVPRVRGRCAWFHFDNVCGPRAHLGAADYIALATRFDAIALMDVPTFSTHNENEARRFINLVDVLYEKHALLLASLAAEPANLFRGEEAEAEEEGEDKIDDDERERDEEVVTTLFSEVVCDNVADPVRDAVKRRVQLEGAWGGGQATVSREGGSSGRSTTMVGGMEWSATGRAGASLADLQRVNFTFRASRRCSSRLAEMGSAAYEATWCGRRH